MVRGYIKLHSHFIANGKFIRRENQIGNEDIDLVLKSKQGESFGITALQERAARVAYQPVGLRTLSQPRTVNVPQPRRLLFHDVLQVVGNAAAHILRLVVF